MAFPTWTALTGLGGALLLSELRRRLAKPAPIDEFRAPRWQLADVVWLLALVAIALLMRLPGLESRPIDNDEPVGLGLRSLDAWAADSDARLHPPLPAILMTLAAHGGIDIDAARGVSALAGIATVALAFSIARSASDRKAAIWAGALVAIAPAALVASGLARGWGLLPVCVLGAHACLGRALASDRERWWLGYSIAVAVALSVEYAALAPLAADALVVAVLYFRRPGVAAATLGAFGAALVACSFYVPFALPTTWLGIGGPVQPASGVLPALGFAIELLAGKLPPLGLAVALAIVGEAAFERRLGPSAWRLLSQVLAIVALLMLGGAVTAVRARYALHALPIFFILISIAARSSRRFRANAGLAVVFATHALLLPCWFGQTCRRNDMPVVAPTPSIDERAKSAPSLAVAIMPAWAIAEPSWRLGRVVPGREALVGCQAELCTQDARRRYYGIRPEISALRKVLEREPRVFLIDRNDAFHGAPECLELIREAGTTLYDCGRVR